MDRYCFGIGVGFSILGLSDTNIDRHRVDLKPRSVSNSTAGLTAYRIQST